MADRKPRGFHSLLRPSPPRSGDVKSSPQKIIAQGADWRFLNELKKELKS
jgi:hypothetical protein